MLHLPQPISYDEKLFDRRFLDCWRRQALVFMEQAGADIDALLYSAFVSSDQIFDETLCGEAPKYAFPTDCLNDEGLALIGWQQTISKCNSFDEARDTIEKALNDSGFAVLMGSVFYFAHNPEYRQEHLNHSIVLTDQAPDGSWVFHDDDPMTTLRPYRYPDHDVAAFFDNNGTRAVRVFRAISSPTPDEINSRARSLFTQRTSQHRDDMRLLSDIRAIATDPHRRLHQVARHLRESFSLLSGSRSLSARFLRCVVRDQDTATLMDACAEQALVLRNLMMKVEYGGRLNLDRLETRCLELRGMESSLLERLTMERHPA